MDAGRLLLQHSQLEGEAWWPILSTWWDYNTALTAGAPDDSRLVTVGLGVGSLVYQINFVEGPKPALYKPITSDKMR